MLVPSSKRQLLVLAALTVAFLLLFYHRRTHGIPMQWTTALQAYHGPIPANRTLGFGAVLVVSTDGSQRRHALMQAANVTDIHFTIPRQPQWTEDDVELVRNGQQKGVQKGSILAWLGHRNALQWLLDSGLETALILEDDVDWDIRLRSLQVPLAASAARTAMPPRRRPKPWTDGAESQAQYWGHDDAWDLLYLGHCGDYFGQVTNDGLVAQERPFSLRHVPHVVYKDPSLPAPTDLHPFTQNLFSALQLPPYSRALHRSMFPLCSFGYAVTRSAADRLLRELAPPKLQEDGPRAFDVALLHACDRGAKTPTPSPSRDPEPHSTPNLRRQHANPGLRCWTLNPELFHHMPGDSQIAQIGQTVGENHGMPPVDLAGQPQVMHRNETTNIACGFWSGAFKFDDGDATQLRFLQDEVGRKGRCLKEGRDA